MPDSDFGLRFGGQNLTACGTSPYQGEVYSPSGEPFVLNLTGFPVPLLAFGEACPEGLGEVRFYSP